MVHQKLPTVEIGELIDWEVELQGTIFYIYLGQFRTLYAI